MSVDYNRECCEQFVQRFTTPPDPPKTVTGAGGPVSFRESILLAYASLAYGYVGWVRYWQHHEKLVAEFRKLSLWNKQGVLYMLVPHIEQLAVAVAKCANKDARINDPL